MAIVALAISALNLGIGLFNARKAARLTYLQKQQELVNLVLNRLILVQEAEYEKDQLIREIRRKLGSDHALIKTIEANFVAQANSYAFGEAALVRARHLADKHSQPKALERIQKEVGEATALEAKAKSDVKAIRDYLSNMRDRLAEEVDLAAAKARPPAAPMTWRRRLDSEPTATLRRLVAER